MTGAAAGGAGRTGRAAGSASGGWQFAGAAFGLLLQLCCLAYAARHVSPAALGAYAVALTAVHLLAHLAATGAVACLHRPGPPTRPTAHAALRLAGITGFTGFAVAQLAAPLPALLLHTPDTTPLLRLLACAFLCHPAAEAAVVALRRAGRARAAVLADTGGQAAGAATGILLLTADADPLGLAAMLPVAAAVTLGAGALLLSRTPLPDGPAVQAAALIRAPRFATWFGLLRLVVAGAPLWAVCGLLGPGAAAVFSRAAVLCEVPVAVYGRVLSRATGWGGGAYGGLGQDLRLDTGQGHDTGPGAGPGAGAGTGAGTGRRPGRGHRVGAPTARLAVTAASAAAFAVFGAAAGAGPAALALLLGPGWESAAALVPWLCAAAALQLVYAAGCSLDLARGRRRELLGTHLVVLLTTAAALAAVLPWRGSGPALPLLACAAAAGPAAGHALQLLRWGRCGLVRVREVLRAHAVHAGIGAAAGTLAALAGSTAAEPGPALLYGLLALAPVALLCAALHRQLPLSAALSGHHATPAPPPRPRTSTRTPAPRGQAGAPVP
ncbi:oligosaccharide flippase family protein [Streptomyces aculeolatus]